MSFFFFFSFFLVLTQKKEKGGKKTKDKKLTPRVDLRLLDRRLAQQLRRRARGLARDEAGDGVGLEHALPVARLERRDLAEGVELEELGRLVRLAHLEAGDVDLDPGVLGDDQGLVGVLVARVGVELELVVAHFCEKFLFSLAVCLRERERERERRERERE